MAQSMWPALYVTVVIVFMFINVLLPQLPLFRFQSFLQMLNLLHDSLACRHQSISKVDH